MFLRAVEGDTGGAILVVTALALHGLPVPDYDPDLLVVLEEKYPASSPPALLGEPIIDLRLDRQILLRGMLHQVATVRLLPGIVHETLLLQRQRFRMDLNQQIGVRLPDLDSSVGG